MLFKFMSCFVIVLPLTCLSIPFAAQKLLNTTTRDATLAPNTSVHTNASFPNSSSASLGREDKHCFGLASPGEFRLIVWERDHFATAHRISWPRKWQRPLSLYHAADVNVTLPVNTRHRTCSTFMTMVIPINLDLIELEAIYKALLGLGAWCCSGIGQYKYVGRAFVGPLSLLYIIIGGRYLSDGRLVLESSDGTQIRCDMSNPPVTPNVHSVPASNALSIDTAKGTRDQVHGAALVARGQLVSRSISTDPTTHVTSSRDTAVSGVVNTFGAVPSLDLATVPHDSSVTHSTNPDSTPKIPQLLSNDTKTFPSSELTDSPTCTAPSYPGPISSPINFADCTQAISFLIGFRDPSRLYIFSRSTAVIPFKYHLPRKFRHGTCVIYLDMVHDEDEVTAKLADVVDSARHLAYACSGSRSASQIYGGHVNVGLSGRNLIVVWIYGRTWGSTPRRFRVDEAEIND